MIASPIPQSSPIFLSSSSETTLKDGTLLSRSWKKTVSQEAKVLGKLEEAIEQLTQAILLNPTSAILYSGSLIAIASAEVFFKERYHSSGICSEHCTFIPSLEKPRHCWNMVCFNHLYGSACICWDFEFLQIITQSYWSLPITLPGDKLSCQGMSLKLGILNTRHGLTFKPSLDEQTLELQVKTSIGAEAISQQRLAAAEAEIADLRQKLEASKRKSPGFQIS